MFATDGLSQFTPYDADAPGARTTLHVVSHPCILSCAGVLIRDSTIAKEQHPRIVRGLKILATISTIWATTWSLTAAQHYSKIPASDLPVCKFRSLDLIQRITGYIDRLNEHDQAALYGIFNALNNSTNWMQTTEHHRDEREFKFSV